MNANYFLVSMLALLCGALVGCGEATDSPAVSNAEIVGTYTGHYASGTETLEIHADGTFAQTFRQGTNAGYTSSGTWYYETNMIWKGLTNKISQVSFSPLTLPAGMSGCATNTKVQVGTGLWQRNPVRIELGAWPYFLTKMQMFYLQRN